MALKWVIAGGGTGGHVMPALALGEAVRARGDTALFVGSDHGLEARLVPLAGFELVTLPSRQVMGRGPWGRARGALSILAAARRARQVLADFEADWVVSVGGYAAMPAVLAAWLSGRPLALLEPNAVPGRVNRLSARVARRVFVGFDAARARLAAPEDRVRSYGVPLRQALVAAFDGAPDRRRPSPPFRLLIFGGSQGARQINETMMDALPRLADLALEVVHQSGEADRERVAQAYAKAGVQAEVVAFEPDMPARYRWADLALCRAGALTVAELALAGLPALLVPYPYAADDHQAANAQALAQAGAGRCLDARALDADALGSALEQAFAEPAGLEAMGRAAAALSRPDAAERIIADCAALLGPPSEQDREPR